MHDRLRVNKGGAPTFDKVMMAVALLRSSGIPFNTLTSVHRWNAKRPLDVYRFLRNEVNATYMQFIPIVQWKGFETTFETLVAQHAGLPAQICIYGETCGRGVALEHDGSVYACDHYVYPEFRRGTLERESLSELVFSPDQRRFGEAKSATLPAYCRQCPYMRDC